MESTSLVVSVHTTVPLPKPHSLIPYATTSGAGHKASHNIYMWDRDSGGLVKILEGPKDPLEDLDVRGASPCQDTPLSLTPVSRLQWHPLRPLIASVSSLGNIHVWVTRIVENWSAYAPEFEELDENQEYLEKEDEFDFVSFSGPDLVQ